MAEHDLRHLREIESAGHVHLLRNFLEVAPADRAQRVHVQCAPRRSMQVRLMMDVVPRRFKGRYHAFIDSDGEMPRVMKDLGPVSLSCYAQVAINILKALADGPLVPTV